MTEHNKQKRDAAVDAYAEAIKKRLDELEDQGSLLLDGFTSHELLADICYYTQFMDDNRNENRFVDLAAKIMELWDRGGRL